MASTPAAPPAEKPFTAVVVFHGMGQQRHHASVWRLIQALDAFVHRSAQRPGAPFVERRLLLKTRRERLRDETGDAGQDELVYTEVQHAVEPGARRVRFYEGYWAPATVGGTSAASVLLWLLAQVPRPLKVLAAPRHGRVTVIYHPPLKVSDFPGRKDLAARSEAMVRAGVEPLLAAP